jgi:4-hydroxy-tetrahydrodipicolinate reductase
MGQRLIALARASTRFRVVGAIECPGHPSIGHDVGELCGLGRIDVPVGLTLPEDVRAVVDFSSPEATREWVPKCRDRGIAMVIGTTGLSPSDHLLIDDAAGKIAVLQAANTSLGAEVFRRVVMEAARLLGDTVDVEIVESHHRFKKDAPSGTASAVKQWILEARGKDARGDVPIHSLRMGDEVGKHTVYLAGMGDRIELTHCATSRDTFASGALDACAWLVNQSPGRYRMADVVARERRG